MTRRLTLPEAIADTTSIHAAACTLLDKVALAPIRLTGVSMSNIVARSDVPGSLFPDRAREKRVALERVAADASARFGKGTLVHAETLSGERRRGDA